MTSYEFEVIAKNATIKTMKEEYGIDVKIEDLDFVWFAHIIGFKKCLLYSPLFTQYIEVTYNKSKEEVYVDVYQKRHKRVFHSDDLYNVKTTDEKVEITSITKNKISI